MGYRVGTGYNCIYDDFLIFEPLPFKGDPL